MKDEGFVVLQEEAFCSCEESLEGNIDNFHFFKEMIYLKFSIDRVQTFLHQLFLSTISQTVQDIPAEFERLSTLEICKLLCVFRPFIHFGCNFVDCFHQLFFNWTSSKPKIDRYEYRANSFESIKQTTNIAEQV